MEKDRVATAQVIEVDDNTCADFPEYTFHRIDMRELLLKAAHVAPMDDETRRLFASQ